MTEQDADYVCPTTCQYADDVGVPGAASPPCPGRLCYHYAPEPPNAEHAWCSEHMEPSCPRHQNVEHGATTWRYCMTRDVVDNEDVFEVREVYTSPDGALSWTEESVSPNGSSWIDCANDIALMSRASNGRVLDLTLDPPAMIDPRDLRSRPGQQHADD